MSLPPSITELIDESIALERSGEVGAALQRAREALNVARASGEDEAIASALNCVAAVLFRIGTYDKVGPLAEEALAIAPADAPPRADALLLLGMRALAYDDLSTAEEHLHRAAELSRQLGYRLALLRALHNLSVLYRDRGQFDLALATAQQVLRIIAERDLRGLAYGPLTNLALIYWLTGQREQAYATLDELRSVALPGSPAEGYAYCVRGNLAQEEGRGEEAEALHIQARSIAEAVGDPPLNVHVRLGQSRYQRARGNTTAARDWAEDALTVATRVRGDQLRGMALIERGRAAWQCGDEAAAESDLRAAVELLSAKGAAFDLARAYLLLAALLHAQERPEADSAWLEAVSRIVSGGYAFLLERERPLTFPLVAHYLNSADPRMQSVAITLLGHLERVPPPPLRIITLGRFEVWQNARQINKRALGQRRAGELLRLLLISPGRTLARDVIIEALWPGKSAEAMQTPFHQATSALRRALEPDLPDKFPSRYLEVEGGQVTLHLPGGSWVDGEAFERSVRQEQWEAALALYGGELFPGDRYADWATERREWLAQCYLRAALGAAHQRLEAGQAEAALEACRRVLAVEPWHEEAVLVGMRASLALHDRAGALRLYRNVERVLRDELGAAPQSELEQFYHKVLQAKTP